MINSLFEKACAFITDTLFFFSTKAVNDIEWSIMLYFDIVIEKTKHNIAKHIRVYMHTDTPIQQKENTAS